MEEGWAGDLEQPRAGGSSWRPDEDELWTCLGARLQPRSLTRRALPLWAQLVLLVSVRTSKPERSGQ